MQNGFNEEMTSSFEPSPSFVSVVYADVERDEQTKSIPPGKQLGHDSNRVGRCRICASSRTVSVHTLWSGLRAQSTQMNLAQKAGVPEQACKSR